VTAALRSIGFLLLLMTLAVPTAMAETPPAKQAEGGKEAKEVSQIPTTFSPRHFSNETGYTLPKGRFEMGLFKPLRFGVTDDIELYTHPIVNVVMPHIGIRVNVAELDGNWSIATEHTLSWPTQLLRTMQGRGYLGGVLMLNGLLPPDAQVPHMLASNHYLHASRTFDGTHTLTVRLGLNLGIQFGEAKMPTVDYPVLYTRMAALHDGISFTGGLDLRGKVYDILWYRIEFDVWGMVRDEGTWAIEHVLQATLRTSEVFSIDLGYKVVIGDYPFGRDAHMFPVFDLNWAWY